jgi:hypothetical protein
MILGLVVRPGGRARNYGRFGTRHLPRRLVGGQIFFAISSLIQA